jgi:hypothetical protein
MARIRPITGWPFTVDTGALTTFWPSADTAGKFVGGCSFISQHGVFGGAFGVAITTIFGSLYKRLRAGPKASPYLITMNRDN